MKGDINDPKALIREAYNIEGISAKECRTIFLDWALGVPIEADTKQIIWALLHQYETDAPYHPMSKTLREGLQTANRPKRQGGSRARKKAVNQ